MEPARVTIVCAGCERRVASGVLEREVLRALTGFVHDDGHDWCPECASAIAYAVRAEREARA